jgi:hypothetical protein
LALFGTLRASEKFARGHDLLELPKLLGVEASARGLRIFYAIWVGRKFENQKTEGIYKSRLSQTNIVLERSDGAFGNQHWSPHAPFPGNTCQTSVEIYIFDPQGSDFAGVASGAIKKFDESLFA